MLLIKITAVIFVLDITLFYLICMSAAHEFIRRYPGLKPHKKPWYTNLLSSIQVGTAFSIPIINILFAYIFVFRSNEIIEKAIHKIYKQCEKEKSANYEELSPEARKIYDKIVNDLEASNG